MLRCLVERSPDTAFITGASSGLGAAYTRLLTAGGYRCTLIARRSDRLEALARELERTGAPQPRLHRADLADPQQLAELARMVASERPNLLVINAGFGLPDAFYRCDPQDLTRMIRVHVDHVVQLLRAFLAPAPDRATEAPGSKAVIVVASIAAFSPAPAPALYTSTKRFQVELVRALAIGHRETAFQVLCPGFVHTEFHSRMGHSSSDRPRLLPWKDATSVARYSLRKLGSGPLVVVPGLAYRILLVLRRAIPEALYRAVVRRTGWRDGSDRIG